MSYIFLCICVSLPYYVPSLNFTPGLKLKVSMASHNPRVPQGAMIARYVGQEREGECVGQERERGESM